MGVVSPMSNAFGSARQERSRTRADSGWLLSAATCKGRPPFVFCASASAPCLHNIFTALVCRPSTAWHGVMWWSVVSMTVADIGGYRQTSSTPVNLSASASASSSSSASLHPQPQPHQQCTAHLPHLHREVQRCATGKLVPGVDIGPFLQEHLQHIQVAHRGRNLEGY